jgi:hypothetical protein
MRNTCTCISLLISNPPLKEKMIISKPQKNTYPPSPATPSLPKTPTHLWRDGCHVSREIMGASEHSTRERDNLAQGLARVPVRHPGSPKKAFAALAPGSWSWVASGIAQFWNLMQERSHGTDFDFCLTPRWVGRRVTVARKKSFLLTFLFDYGRFCVMLLW